MYCEKTRIEKEVGRRMFQGSFQETILQTMAGTMQSLEDDSRRPGRQLHKASRQINMLI
jgi:hypothetical protein